MMINKIKYLLHCVRVVCGGGYMMCINNGCEKYHGLKEREHHFFLDRKFAEGLKEGLIADSAESAKCVAQRVKEETENIATKW